MATTEGDRGSKPFLFIDVDGVISLFGFSPEELPLGGRFHTVDGVAHFISGTAGEHLLALGASFELVWCTGWEEKANEYLPHLLGLPGPLPYLVFAGHYSRSPTVVGPEDGAAGGRHWKLDAIEAHAGPRPLAWIDDCHSEDCRAWAAGRPAPTLLVATEPATGLVEDHIGELIAWAWSLNGDLRQSSGEGSHGPSRASQG